jgi:hypothetical protein
MEYVLRHNFKFSNNNSALITRVSCYTLLPITYGPIYMYIHRQRTRENPFWRLPGSSDITMWSLDLWDLEPRITVLTKVISNLLDWTSCSPLFCELLYPQIRISDVHGHIPSIKLSQNLILLWSWHFHDLMGSGRLDIGQVGSGNPSSWTTTQGW